MPAKQFIDWQIPDPKEMNQEDFRQVRSIIEGNVKQLLQQLTHS
jgi:protein-tyrosine-phosphatase